MKSKKRTIGIIIVVIVVLLGFASSLLIYKNKLSSDNINNDLNKENVLKNYFYVTEEENIVYDSINHIKYVNNELEIVAENGTDMNDIHELAKKYNAEIVGEIEILNTYQFKFNENFTLSQLEEIITDIKESSFVLDANINYVWDNFYNTYEINKGDIWKNETWNEEIPDGKNWGIEAIQCISAWGLLNKESINPVRIGIIDNVFDENHEDLGFAKTYYNCSQSELLKYVSENDSYEHGTNVAGVMAANSRLDSHGSDLGICGVYPFGYENLYGVSFIGASKTNIAIESYLVTLIVENNVKVINISCLGNVNLTFRASHLNEDSAKDEFKKASLPIEEKLIELIRLKYDFLICTSAGNESYGWFKENKDGEYEQIRDKWDVFGATKTDIIDAKYGPLFATIDNEELKKRIVVVGAIEQEKNHMQICSYSNGGKRVDIYAPGEKITTTSVDNKYCYYFKGTSAAAPFVSGTAAMVWSVNNNLTGEEVKEILCNTAKCPENSGSEYFKMVNAKLAVEEAIRRKDTLVVPIEDETQLTEFVEIEETKNYEWYLNPTIEAEDIIVSDEYSNNTDSMMDPYDECAIIQQNEKYGIIKYDGLYIAESKYNKYFCDGVYEISVFNEYRNDGAENVNVFPAENKLSIEVNYEGGRGNIECKYIYDSSSKQIYCLSSTSSTAKKYTENSCVLVEYYDFDIIGEYNKEYDEYKIKERYEKIDSSKPKYGIAKDGKLLVQCEYEDGCMNFCNGVVALKKDGKWGYFYDNGNQIIDFICEPFTSKILYGGWWKNTSDITEYPFLSTNGYIPVKIDGQCGYYDTQGNEVIPCGTFEEVRPVHNGLAWVKKDGKWGVIELEDIEQETESTNIDETIDYEKIYYDFIENELVSKYGLSNLNSIDLDYSAPPNYNDWYGIISGEIFNINGNCNLLTVALKEIDGIPHFILDLYGYNEKVYLIDSFDKQMSADTIRFNTGWNEEYFSITYWHHFNYVSSNYGMCNTILTIENNGFNPVFSLNYSHWMGGGVFINNSLSEKTYFQTDDGSSDGLSEGIKLIEGDLSSIGISNYEINREIDPESFSYNINFTKEICDFSIYEEDGKPKDYTELRSHITIAEEKPSNKPTEGQPYNATVSDNEILSAVNKYLEENQNQLGVWLSDGNPYCPAQYMTSTETKWSCPINLSWESYSPNEIAGSYPYFAFVDKETLKCTITANYDTVVEFDLSDYLE